MLEARKRTPVPDCGDQKLSIHGQRQRSFLQWQRKAQAGMKRAIVETQVPVGPWTEGLAQPAARSERGTSGADQIGPLDLVGPNHYRGRVSS